MMMILDEFVSVCWIGSNKKYYVERGYIFTKFKQPFLVKIEDLMLGSNIRIHVKCDICNTEKYIKYQKYIQNISKYNYYGCSHKCSINKFWNTNLDKYNNKYPAQNDVIKEKTKQTNLKKYGVGVPSQNNVIKEKTKQTNLKKYGVICPMQNDEINEKTKQTNLKKYGVENASKCDKIKKKIKETNLKKYGSEFCIQNEKIKEKAIDTNLKKRGVRYSLQSEVVREKIKQTNFKKYGCEYSVQSEVVKNKIKETNLRKYGCEYSHQNKKIAEKAINTIIERYGEVWLSHIPRYNPNSIIYLDMISEKLNLPIQHALNGGEKKFVRYHIDGYIEEYNICIEWDERHHKIKKF